MPGFDGVPLFSELPNVDSKPRSKRGPYYSEEVLRDGFHYRKYGQKFSKANPYPTCYYKCAHPNCPVKRQISRSDDGKIVNQYRGVHNHAPPQMRQARAETQEEFVKLVREEGRFLDWEGGQSTAGIEKKLVITAAPSVNPADDSFSWKKYGSKVVKASTVQKSYYRCAVSSCTAKRLIQRPTDPVGGAREEAQVVYQGAHSHGMPARSAKQTRPTVTPTLAPAPALGPVAEPVAPVHDRPAAAATLPTLDGAAPLPPVSSLPMDDLLLHNTGSSFIYWGGAGVGLDLPRDSTLPPSLALVSPGIGPIDLTGLPTIPTIMF